MQIKQGLNGGGALSRIDSSLIPKTQEGTDVYQNVRQFRQPVDLLNPSGGSRKITLSPPNSGFLNLRDIKLLGEITIEGGGNAGMSPFPFIPAGGEVWKWDGSGRDPDPAFPDVGTTTWVTNINQGLSDPFWFTLIERIVIQAGGTPIADTQYANLIGHHQRKLAWNTAFLEPLTSTYQGYNADNGDHIYGVPQAGYWENVNRLVANQPANGNYRLCSTPQPIEIPLFNFNNAFLNGSDGILPLQFMPNVTIEIYFASAENVLKQQIPFGYTHILNNQARTGQIAYYMRNLKLECLMGASNQLEKSLIAQGMSMTFRDFAYFNRQIVTNSGNFSFQVPVVQRAIERVYLIIRKQDEMQDLTVAGKLSSYWPVQRVIQAANIRINGIKRYGEDLDSRGMYMELMRLSPSAKTSELLKSEWDDWNAQNQLVVFSSQMDYSQEYLSAIKTASQTSPLIIDIQWAGNINSGYNLNFEILVQYAKWLSVTREQIEIID